METSAVYMEPRIKIYGLNEAFDLSFFQMEFNASRMAEWGLWLTALDDLTADQDAAKIRFEWTLIQCVGHKALRLGLVFKNRWSRAVLDHFQTHGPSGDDASAPIISPAEALYFHGPHFADRHGIADATLNALKERQIEIRGAGCSGASVYLLFFENGVKKARPVMEALFETPA